MRLYYAAVQNLVYGRGYIPQTTAECSDRLQIHGVQHVNNPSIMPIQLPAGLQCDSVQMDEVVQEGYVLVGGAWFYSRVNVANTSHL